MCPGPNRDTLRNPLALRGSFEQHPHRRVRRKQPGELLPGRGNPAVDDLAGVGHDSHLTLRAVEIDGTIRHGWPLFLRFERVC